MCDTPNLSSLLVKVQLVSLSEAQNAQLCAFWAHTVNVHYRLLIERGHLNTRCQGRCELSISLNKEQTISQNVT